MSAKQQLFAWCTASCLKPQLAVEDRADPVLEAAGRRLAIPFCRFLAPDLPRTIGAGSRRRTASASVKRSSGRAGRADHAGDKKPVLAAALETAFDPAQSQACIGLDQAPRYNAAIWLPPGMAYAAVKGNPPADLANPDAQAEAGDDIGLAADELPPFLTGDEPAARPRAHRHADAHFSENADRIFGAALRDFPPEASRARQNPRRAERCGGASMRWAQRSRGSHSAMWVAPSSAGCSSLTRRQRTHWGPNSGQPILRLR